MNNVFVDNINYYLKHRGIKHNYITLMTGWDKSKISRLLSGNTDLKWNDIVSISNALGHDVNYFINNEFDLERNEGGSGQIAFFAGNLQDEDRKIADKLIEMFRFYDALTSIQL